MRLPRTLSLILVLMLAAALPLRGYAAMAQCEGSLPAGVHAGHAAHCNDGTGPPHTGGCSDCCCAAAASSPPRWSLPQASASKIAVPSIWAPPSLVPHRLDRPPRPSL
ncbi:MAG: hypothetical protein ABSC32_18445 [Steroidobacteraceae bacterium]